MTDNEEVVAGIAVTVPDGWSPAGPPPGRAGTDGRAWTDGRTDAPSLLTVTVDPDDAAPADALLGALVADLFLERDVQYEPIGEITQPPIDGFEAASMATGELTLTAALDRTLAAPTRYRLAQIVAAGPGAQRVHAQLAVPLDGGDDALSATLTERIRLVDGAPD